MNSAARSLMVILALTACDGGISNAEKNLGRSSDLPEVPVEGRAVPAPASAVGTLGGETSGGLAVLLEVGARLARAIAAYRAGEDPSAALAPIAFQADERVRGDLEAVGAASVTHLGFELELLFYEKGRARYYLRTLVHAGADGVSFLRLQAKPQLDGDLRVHGQPFERWTGAGEPFAAAGRALLERLLGPECKSLPIASFSRLRALIPNDKQRVHYDRELEEAKTSLPAICATMPGLAKSHVELRVDDHLYLVRTREGAAVGILRGQLAHGDDGSVTLVLGRYRPLR